MAPAIVHFLVGAALLLLFATPFALRFDRLRRGRLWLVIAGGLWGLTPDVHHIAPVLESRLESAHDSSWADLFAFHYTLDQPPLGELTFETIFAAILLFLVAIAVFTAVGNVRGDGLQSRFTRAVTGLVCVTLAAVIAAAVFTTVFYVSGRLESVAALYGRESARAGVAFLLAWSLGCGVLIAAILEVVDTTVDPTDPVAGTTFGLLITVFGWLFGIVFALPVWMDVVLDISRPIPYLHWQSLVGLILFGLIFGVCYPLLRQLVGPPSTANRRV